MLRRIGGITRGKIRSKYIHSSIGVAPMIDKIRDNRLI